MLVTQQAAAGACPAFRKCDGTGGASSPRANACVGAPFHITIVFFAGVNKNPCPVHDLDEPAGNLKACSTLYVSQRFMEFFLFLSFYFLELDLQVLLVC